MNPRNTAVSDSESLSVVSDDANAKKWDNDVLAPSAISMWFDTLTAAKLMLLRDGWSQEDAATIIFYDKRVEDWHNEIVLPLSKEFVKNHYETPKYATRAMNDLPKSEETENKHGELHLLLLGRASAEMVAIGYYWGVDQTIKREMDKWFHLMNTEVKNSRLFKEGSSHARGMLECAIEAFDDNQEGITVSQSHNDRPFFHHEILFFYIAHQVGFLTKVEVADPTEAKLQWPTVEGATNANEESLRDWEMKSSELFENILKVSENGLQVIEGKDSQERANDDDDISTSHKFTVIDLPYTEMEKRGLLGLVSPPEVHDLTLRKKCTVVHDMARVTNSSVWDMSQLKHFEKMINKTNQKSIVLRTKMLRNEKTMRNYAKNKAKAKKKHKRNCITKFQRDVFIFGAKSPYRRARQNLAHCYSTDLPSLSSFPNNKPPDQYFNIRDVKDLIVPRGGPADLLDIDSFLN